MTQEQDPDGPAEGAGAPSPLAGPAAGRFAGNRAKVAALTGAAVVAVGVAGVAVAVALQGGSGSTDVGKPLAVTTPDSSVSSATTPPTSPSISSSAASASPSTTPSPVPSPTQSPTPSSSPTTPRQPAQPVTPTRSGPSCLIGTWSLYWLRQQDLFINNTVVVPVAYKSGSLRYTYSGNGTVAVRATSVRLGGTGADHHFYEALISASGSTSYTVHSNGTISYSDAAFAPGTFATYVDHVLQSTTSGNEWVGTTDTYTCSGNTFRISGTDNFGHSYAYSFGRLS